MSDRGQKESEARWRRQPGASPTVRRAKPSQSVSITPVKLGRVAAERGSTSQTRRREDARQDSPAHRMQPAVKESLDDSVVSFDSQVTMQSVAGQFRRPVKVTLLDGGPHSEIQQLAPEKIRDKLEKTLKLQKEMRHKHEFRHEFDEPGPCHDRNAIQELAQLAKTHQGRDATTMIHQMQQEMMEKYLPNNKFTKEVVFYDDYIFILEDRDAMLNKNTFEEQLHISKFEIKSVLDYEGYDPSDPERESSLRQKPVASCPSIKLTCSDGSMESFQKRFKYSLCQRRLDDGQRRFNFIRERNMVYYIAMERDLARPESIFKVYKIDLDSQDTFTEVEALRQTIPDTNQMALQMLIIQRETKKRYRDPNKEQRKDWDEIQFLKEQIVAVKYAPILPSSSPLTEQLDSSYQMIVRFQCLGDMREEIMTELNINSHDYFNPSRVNHEDFSELTEAPADESKELEEDLKPADKHENMMEMLGRGLKREVQKQKNLQSKRNEGLVYFVIPCKGSRWHQFIHLQLTESGIKPVKDSTVRLDNEQLERHRLVISENCFHHKWDDAEKSFYFQRCDPIHKKCLILLDMVMNKFITVDDKKTHDMQEENLQELDDSDLDLEAFSESVTVTTRTLQNYGCFFEKELPLHWLAMMPKYGNAKKDWIKAQLQYPELRKSLVEDRPLSVFVAQQIAQMSVQESEKHKQLVISNKFANVARCEDKLLFWNMQDRGAKEERSKNQNRIKALEYDDPELKVCERLGLQNANYFSPQKASHAQSSRKFSTLQLAQNQRMTDGLKKMATLSLPSAACRSSSGQDSKQKNIQHSCGKHIVQLIDKDADPIIFKNENAKLTATSRVDFEERGRKEKKEQRSRSKQHAIKDQKKLNESWRIAYEKIRFHDDLRSRRPLVVYQLLSNESGKIKKVNYWLILFDFASAEIVGQVPLRFPDLDLLYEPSVSISGCGRLYCKQNEAKKGYEYSQNFQISFALGHQRRIKIIEYRMSWQELFHSDDAEVKMNHVGTREIILQKKEPGQLHDKFQYQLIPLLSIRNTIIGTQLVECSAQADIFIFDNFEDTYPEKIPLNPLIEKIGYKINRSRLTGEIAAVMAYTKVNQALIGAQAAVELTGTQISGIIEQQVRVVLNSVIFDPMTQLFTSKCMPWFFQNSVGRCFESLSWYQPITVKGYANEIDYVLPKTLPPVEMTKAMRQACEPVSSLIERVMLNDYCKFKHEATRINQNIEQNFNRVETLINDKLLYQGLEYLQRDFQFNTPLHYLKKGYDHEVDLILQKVFLSATTLTLPIAKQNLFALMFEVINRKIPLKVYHENFIQDDPVVKKQINIVQKIVGKDVPLKSDDPLQVFHLTLNEDQWSLPDDKVVGDLLKGYVDEGRIEKGIDYELDCKFIDLRYAKLEQKLQYLKQRAYSRDQLLEPPEFQFSTLEFAKFVNKIAQSRYCNLEDEDLIRDFINSMWEDTQGWQMLFFIIYIVGYLIPFFAQIFFTDFALVVAANFLCLLSVLTLFVYEFVQMRETGFSEYIDDFWNKMDVCNISFCILYFPIRVYMAEEPLLDLFAFEEHLSPEDPAYGSRYKLKFTLVLINVLLVPIAVMKLLNYLRLIENFGLFILLVGHCLNDIRIFLCFMLMWIVIFTTILYILRCDIPNPEDYPQLPYSLQLLTQIWRDSLGDIQPPEYSYWQEKQVTLDKYADLHGYQGISSRPVIVIIGIIWFIWFLNSVFNMIIMLNFMISIVQASYMRVMATRNQYIYQYKSDLNQEVNIFKKIFVSSDLDVDAVILLTKSTRNQVVGDEDADEMKGLLLSMRMEIDKVLNQQDAMLQAHYHRMDEVAKANTQMIANIEEAKNNQSKLLRSEIKHANENISELSKKIDQMKQTLEKVAQGVNATSTFKISFQQLQINPPASLKSAIFSQQ